MNKPHGPDANNFHTENDVTKATHKKAARELEQLQAQIEKSRAVLARLHQDIAQTGNIWATQQPQIVEANEQLVLATLNAQIDAEAVALALEKASRAAELDPLTQLPNRVLLLDRLTHAIASVKRNRTHLALLFLDLNKFKEINDTFGHAAGDQVLKRVAYCLTSSVRETDTVSRYGGDEFLILLAEVAQAADAVVIADKVLAALATPSPVGDVTMSLTASIGISIYPHHGEDTDTLISHADTAMYHAKKRNLGSLIYCEEESDNE